MQLDNDTLGQLRSLQLFQNVPFELIEPYLRQSEEWRIRAGEILLAPDTRNTHIFGILNGCLAVHLNTIHSAPLATLEPGECIGEVSIIDGRHPSAYVVASEDSRLLAMTEHIFWSLVDKVPAVNHNLLRILCQRMRHDGTVIIDKEQHANIDALTGLSNRRGLEQSFTRERQRCISEGQPLCLIMVDIDYFKRFNDQYGHLAGDKALGAVAHLLREHMRTGDIVARFGGEEFSILLPETGLQKATSIAERVRQIISETAIDIAESNNVTVTISLGVTQMQAGEPLETLMANADAALYEAKRQGRNRVCQYQA